MNLAKKLLRRVVLPLSVRLTAYIREVVDERTSGHVTRISDAEIWLNSMEERINQLEVHTIQRRCVAIDEISGYLALAELPGDYLEFGVSTGHTFAYAFKTLSLFSPKMRFVALDSFEGLPEAAGINKYEGYTGGFSRSDYVCAKDEFLAHMAARGVDLSRVITVEGWFDKTLTPAMAQENKIEKIAVAWIDCDYYKSTVPVLKFITPYLTVGSVIAFDDWRCFRNQPDRGEQRACAEWLEENPHIKLRELFSFGWNGLAFTVSDK